MHRLDRLCRPEKRCIKMSDFKIYNYVFFNYIIFDIINNLSLQVGRAEKMGLAISLVASGTHSGKSHL